MPSMKYSIFSGQVKLKVVCIDHLLELNIMISHLIIKGFY